MELIRSLHNLRAPHRGCVVSIGNFDGMHLGHQALLGQLLRTGEQRKLTPAVVIFEPQPREYFAPQAVPSRLTRLREKLEALRLQNVPRVLCLRFDAQLAALEADEFTSLVLVQGLGAGVVLVGHDFRYGRERRGDLQSLRAQGASNGFDVELAATFCIDGERVSSSRVRTALEVGDLALAARLLGRNYSMSGRVAHGEKRGRQIGYPTLNIDLHRVRTPIDGIFAARVHGLSVLPRDGMAYIGTRPVVNGRFKRLEVHVFDYAEECYGRHVQVEFVRKLRGDQAFDSLESLQRQMDVDAKNARAALASTNE